MNNRTHVGQIVVFEMLNARSTLLDCIAHEKCMLCLKRGEFVIIRHINILVFSLLFWRQIQGSEKIGYA